MSGSAALLTNDRPSCKHSTAIGRKCSPSVRASTPNVSTQSADSQITLITQGRAQDLSLQAKTKGPKIEDKDRECIGGAVGRDTVRTNRDGLSEELGFNPRVDR